MYIIHNTTRTEDEVLQMPFSEFRREINYITDPEGFMKVVPDVDGLDEEIDDFQRRNIEFMRRSEEKRKENRMRKEEENGNL